MKYKLYSLTHSLSQHVRRHLPDQEGDYRFNGEVVVVVAGGLNSAGVNNDRSCVTDSCVYTERVSLAVCRCHVSQKSQNY